MFQNQVNGQSNIGSHQGSTPEWYSITTQINISGSNQAFNKIVEIISQRAQPVIIGSVTADTSTPVNYTVNFSVEHTGVWSPSDLLNSIVANQNNSMGFTTQNTLVTIGYLLPSGSSVVIPNVSVNTVPAAPTISVTSGAAQNSIAWTDGSNGGATITAHKLYRGTTSGSLTLVATINSGSPYLDTALTNGTTYYYTVSAVNSVGEGVQSSQANGTPSAVVAGLGPTTSSYTQGTAPGTQIVTINGLQTGEYITSISPNDGRSVLNSAGTAVLVGMTSASPGTINYTLTSSNSRSLSLALTVNAASLTTVYRADATNADMANILASTGGSSYATTTITQMFSQTAIAAGATVQLLVPLRVFSASGTILEVDIPNATDFAAALLYPAATNLAAVPTTGRTQATVAGAGGVVFHYTPGGQSAPHIALNVVVPTAIPANTAYSVLLTHEGVAGRTAAVTNTQIQMATQMSNVIQRYGGALQTAARAQTITSIANSGTNIVITVAAVTTAVGAPIVVTGTTNYNGTYIIAGQTGTTITCASGTSGRATETSGTIDPSHINTNACMTATAFTAYASTVNAGSSPFITVGAVLLPFASNSTVESCVANGNSKQAGNFEGVYGATTPDGVVHGDRSGDAKGNRGAARLLWNQGRGVAQMSKGSDRDLWRMITPTYTGTIAGTTLTVSAIASGAVYPGQQVNGASAGTVITAGTLFTASSSTASATLTVSQMTTTTGAALAVGQMVFNNGVYIGTISALGTGTGGVGTYTLAANAAVTANGVLMASNVFTVNNSQTISTATTFTAQSNYFLRSAFLAACNPQRAIGMCSTNELGPLPNGTTPASAYAASTAYALDKVVYNGANFYICGGLFDTSGGTTGASSAPTGTTPGVPYADGSVYWYWIGSTLSGSAATANSQDCYGAGWVGQRRQRERLDRAAAPKCKIYGVTQTPLTTPYTETLTSAGYSYNSTSGVLTFTPANIARYNTGAMILVSGLTPAGMNGYLQCTVSGSTVSVTVAASLAAPTGTATLNNEWQDTAGQTIQATYTAQAAAGTGMKSWINRFLRNAALTQPVLGYLGVVDMDQYLESGNPTTPGAETGVWSYLTDGGGNRVQATSEGGHETSYAYERAYVAAANDTSFTTAFAA